MTTRHWTFNDLLAALKYNVGQSTMPEGAGITQIRKHVAKITFTAIETATVHGPNYFVYPAWNTADLQGWWTLAGFETVTGSGGVRDIVGSQNGTINGDPTLAQTFDDLTKGRRRHYTTFDGAGDFVNIGDITALDGASQWTWACRARRNDDDPTGAQALIARAPSTTSNRQFAIILGSVSFGASVVLVDIRDDAGTQSLVQTNATIVQAGRWHDVLVVWDGTQPTNDDRVVIYVDGIARAFTSPSNAFPAVLGTSTADVMIGRTEFAPSQDFRGDLQDVVFWDTALTAAQALAWTTDSIADRIQAGLFKVPGDFTNEIVPTLASYTQPNPRHRRHMNGYRHQITSQV